MSVRIKLWPQPPTSDKDIVGWIGRAYNALVENGSAVAMDVATDIATASAAATPLAHKTTEDALNGLVKVNGAGTYSAITDNSTNWDSAYGWGDWHHTTISGYGITDIPSNCYTVLSTTSGIDAKTVALTTLYTVPAGKTLVPVAIYIRVTALTGGKTTQAGLQVGGNSATYNDMVGSIYPTMAASGMYTRLQSPTQGVFYAAGTVIKLSIIGGSNATTETWAVDLIGYLV
jgi:hypothetical protein